MNCSLFVFINDVQFLLIVGCYQQLKLIGKSYGLGFLQPAKLMLTNYNCSVAYEVTGCYLFYYTGYAITVLWPKMYYATKYRNRSCWAEFIINNVLINPKEKTISQ